MVAPKKILLAEDDMDDQKLFCDFLRHRTDIVLLPVVENGEELLEALTMIETDDQLPDFILLDQNMPKRNGIQTLKALKESDRYSHIAVIVYSTYTDEHLVKVALDGGAASVVSKPISKDGYNEMIDDFFKLLP